MTQVGTQVRPFEESERRWAPTSPTEISEETDSTNMSTFDF